MLISRKKAVEVLFITTDKRTVLSEIERSKIDAYLKCSKYVPEISKLLKKSVHVI